MMRLTLGTFLRKRAFRKLGEGYPTFTGTLLTVNTLLKRNGLPPAAAASVRKAVSGAVRARYLPFDPGRDLFRRIQIQTRTGCNLSCPFCPANKKGFQLPKGEMPRELFEKIMGDLSALGFRGVVHLYLQNEPLLDGRLEDLVRITRRNCPASSIVIESNGTLLDLDRYRDLVDAGMDMVYVNNYSPDRQGYLTGYKTKDDIFDRLQPVDSDPVYGRHILINQNRSWSEQLTNRAGNAGRSEMVGLPLTAFCLRPFDQLYIGYDGSVLLCCQDWRFEEIMGDASRQSIGEIWRNDRYQDVRRSLLRSDRTRYLCERCDFQGWP